MTSEVAVNNRITKLEERVIKLEKIIINREDVLNPNFEGYETPTEEELKELDEAEEEIINGNVRSLEDILDDLEC